MTPERSVGVGVLSALGITGVFAVLRHAARVNKIQAESDIARHREYVRQSQVNAQAIRDAATKRRQHVADAGMQLELQRRGIFAAGVSAEDPAMSRYVSEAARQRWQ